MSAQGGEVVCAEFLCGGCIAWWKCMLVRKLSAEVGYAARLGWIKVEFEPLMARAEVVDLEAPMALVSFVTELAKCVLIFNLPHQIQDAYEQRFHCPLVPRIVAMTHLIQHFQTVRSMRKSSRCSWRQSYSPCREKWDKE